MTNCNHIPCDKEGIFPVTIDIGYGMVGQGWFCNEHLPKEINNKDSKKIQQTS